MSVSKGSPRKVVVLVAVVAVVVAVAFGAVGASLWGDGTDGDASGTRTETRPIRMLGEGGLVLGDGQFTSEDGYYTIACNDGNTIVYDASRLDDIFEEDAADVTLADLDAAIDANGNIPDDFAAVAHDYCAALVSHYPNLDLRVLWHNLQRLRVRYEDEDRIQEESDDREATAYFNRFEDVIAMPTNDRDYSTTGWGRQMAYHELVHATRLYAGTAEDGTSTWVCFLGPDDQTKALHEALTSLVAIGLMDEQPASVSYRRNVNYAQAILASLEDYGLEDFLSHSSQWLTRKLDGQLGGDGGQLLLELVQMQTDDLSDGHAEAPSSANAALYHRLCKLYCQGSISADSTYEEAEAVAEELVTVLREGLGESDETLDADCIRQDVRELCRELGVAGVPDEDPAPEDGAAAQGADEDAGTDASPADVAYLASFTEHPQATYQVLAYGSQGQGTSPGQYSDEAADRNWRLTRDARAGGGQYLALYADGTCRLFDTADGETADVSIGYWDADEDEGVRNFTLAHQYYDEGVFEDGDSSMVATGSSRVTMLLGPSDFDVRGLKPYHTAARDRHEGYEEHNAFEGGWTYQGVEPAAWIGEDPELPGDLGDGDLGQLLQDQAELRAGVADLAEALDQTIAAGGYQRIYIDGGGMWRMASDGITSQRVLEGRFEVDSLAQGVCRARDVSDGNPLASDASFTPTFELVDADTLVEHRGYYDVTYQRDGNVHDPCNDSEVAPEAEVVGNSVTLGSVTVELPDGFSESRTLGDGVLFRNEGDSVTIHVCRDLPMPTDDVRAADLHNRRLVVSVGARGEWETDWRPETVDVRGASMAVRGLGTYTFSRYGRSERYHALMLRVGGYTYYIYASEDSQGAGSTQVAYPLEGELEAMLDSVMVMQ